MADNDIVVDWLRREEIPAAAYAISVALAADPNFIVLFGSQSEQQRARIEKALLLANLNHPKAIALAARYQGRLVGALNMVEWPYCQVGFMEGLKLFPKFLSLVRGGIIRATQIQMIGEKLDPHEPHYHIGPIGILPEAQAHGLGWKICGDMCDYLDEHKACAYFETDVKFLMSACLKFGFVIRRELDILGIHNWCMWRAPK